MIELELKRKSRHSTDRMDTPCRQVDCPDLGLNELHATKDATKRIDNIARIEISRGDLVQHWRKQNEVLAVDQDNFCIRPPRQRFVQTHGRAEAGEAASGNDNAGLFHSLSPL